MAVLLTRDQFREAVFERDGNRCVVCGRSSTHPYWKPGGVIQYPLDAHHIMERRLWPDGGYYLDNGVTVCSSSSNEFRESCHLQAEQTLITPQELRDAAGIEKVLLPPQLYSDHEYDKWGNIVLTNGTRSPGELFNDESVQKVLAPVLDLFNDHIKYPRTYHLPWSPGFTKDDKVLKDLSSFEGKRVIVTEKLDGENTTMYRDYIHARSLDSAGHPSQTWSKRIQADVGWEIPEGWRICGENLQAKHAIHYKDIPSYFAVFSIWDENNNCLPWDETVEYAKMLGLESVPVLYDGIYDEDAVRSAFTGDSVYGTAEGEGYVLRIADGFHYSAFRQRVGKFVRADHVQKNVHHWKYQPVVFNELQERV